MSIDSTDAAWAAARAAEPDAMCRDDIVALLAQVRRARACLDAIEMRAARRVRELESVGSAEPADSLLANAGGHCGRDAHAVTERDELCEQMPAVEDAFVDGELPAGYVDAIATAARGLPEAVRAEYTAMTDELLGRARRRLPRRVPPRVPQPRPPPARQVPRRRRHRRARRAAGRVKGDALGRQDHRHAPHPPRTRPDPRRQTRRYRPARTRPAPRYRVDHPRLDSAPTRRVRQRHRRDHDPVASDTDTDTETDTGHERVGASGRRSDRPTTDRRCHCATPGPVDRVPEITALVSYDWLTGHSDHGICETEAGDPIPIATMRRLCCDAEIIPIVLGAARRSPRPRPLPPHRHPATTTGPTGDVPQLRPPRLQHRVRRLSHPPHPLVVAPPRPHRPRQPHPPLRTPPPPGPRRRLDPHHDPRPHRHLATTRRRRPPSRADHQSEHTTTHHRLNEPPTTSDPPTPPHRPRPHRQHPRTQAGGPSPHKRHNHPGRLPHDHHIPTTPQRRPARPRARTRPDRLTAGDLTRPTGP